MTSCEELCLKDAELSFKAMEFGSLKYMGQVRMMPVYGNSEGSAGANGYKNSERLNGNCAWKRHGR